MRGLLHFLALIRLPSASKFAVTSCLDKPTKLSCLYTRQFPAVSLSSSMLIVSRSNGTPCRARSLPFFVSRRQSSVFLHASEEERTSCHVSVKSGKWEFRFIVDIWAMLTPLRGSHRYFWPQSVFLKVFSHLLYRLTRPILCS